MRACALLLGSCLLCLHISWMMNGRMVIHAGDFAGTFIRMLPDSIVRFFAAPVLGVANLLIIIAIAGIIVCVLGRWIAGLLLAAGVLLALAVANQVKLQMLQELGCDYVQGYFLARPMSASQYEEFMVQRDLRCTPCKTAHEQ